MEICDHADDTSRPEAENIFRRPILNNSDINKSTSAVNKNTRTWRPIQQNALRRLNAEIFETLAMRHRQDDGFDKLLNLLIQTADIAVLLRRAFVNLKLFNQKIIYYNVM